MAELEYPKRVLREDVILESDGATYDDLKFPVVPHGEQWHVCSVAATDEDNTITKWGVFIQTKGDKIWINEQAFTTAAVRRHMVCECWLREGEQLVVRVTGAADGDTIRAWLVGTYEEIGELVGFPTRFGEL